MTKKQMAAIPSFHNVPFALILHRRGCSSVGRASALHAEGLGFDSRQLHLAFVSERSKELDSSSSVFALVGSNPTECISFLFAECLLLTLSFDEYNNNYWYRPMYSLDRCYNLSLFSTSTFSHVMTISHI